MPYAPKLNETKYVRIAPKPSPTPSWPQVVHEISIVFGPDGKQVVRDALNVAACESGWEEKAQNRTSSAGGVFQFIDGTWIRMRNKMGVDPSLELKKDYKANIRTAYALYKYEKIKWSNWECKPL